MSQQLPTAPSLIQSQSQTAPRALWKWRIPAKQIHLVAKLQVPRSRCSCVILRYTDITIKTPRGEPNLEYGPSHASGQEPTSGPPSLRLGRNTTPNPSPKCQQNHSSGSTDANTRTAASSPLSMFLLQTENEAPWTALRATETSSTCVHRMHALMDDLGECLSPTSTEEVTSFGDQMHLDYGASWKVTHDGSEFKE